MFSEVRIFLWASGVRVRVYLIIKERKGFPAGIFDWSRAEVLA